MNNFLDFCGYTLFSFLEGGAFFVLIFCAFRIELKEYIKEIVITNILISFVSFFVKEVNFISNIFPLINLIVVIVVLITLFKISTLYAIFVASFGFISCALIQGLVVNAAQIIYPLSMEEIRNTEYIHYTFQVISSVVVAFIALTFKKKRLWFTMLPYDFKLLFKLTYKNMIIVIASSVGLIVIGLMLNITFALTLFFMLILLICMVYLGISREKSGGFD